MVADEITMMDTKMVIKIMFREYNGQLELVAELMIMLLVDSSDARIGDGAYGVVYRAMDRVNNEKVALKRIKLENEEGTENLVFLLFFLL